ncbi:18029_t:CDS:10 [Acaulospora morrowiae]|uniref:18029_t:CDS:1 n=1 Tax=Acaulospora morrowiae TaxID=94023 RepID=A0A9N8VV54_9GLOM|nr:18029_t:CDS:10 [Acaulospora morrowiae]
MQLTTECLKALKSGAFWESTDTPSLHKYLKFRLHEGNLEAEETEHLRYNSDLNIISKYYSESSEVGQKVLKWKQDFKMRGLCRHQLPCWFRTGIGKGFVLVGEHAINCGVLVCKLFCIVTDYHADFVLAVGKNDKNSYQINNFWDLQVKRNNIEMEIKLLEKEQNKMETQICLEQTHHILDVTRDTREQGLLLRKTITNKFERRVLNDSLEPRQKRKKNLSLSKNKGSKKTKSSSRDVEDDDFISNNRAEGSTRSKATSSLSGSLSLEMPIETESTGSSRGATEMTCDMNDVNSSGWDIPRTPPHQICSTSKNQDLLKRLRQEKQRVKSTYEPICSNIIDTTNKPLMDRLKIERDYTWDPFTNEATKYIDELIDNSDTRNKFRNKLQLPFVLPDETYSFSKLYEIHWVHRFADKLSLFFEAPRNPLLDKNSEGWLNCHVLTPLIDDCFLTCEEIQIHRGEEISLASTERKNLLRDESEKKKSEPKIDILFRIDDVEYFGSETYVDEDPQNSKPISCKHKILREIKDQLDRFLKKLKFTRETIRWIKNIVVHGINQGGSYGEILVLIIFHSWLRPILYIQGFNGKIYAMYYDNDLQHYFVFETCRYRIGTTWGSIPESLMSLKDILCLKKDINNVLDTVKKIKLITLRTKLEICETWIGGPGFDI